MKRLNIPLTIALVVCLALAVWAALAEQASLPDGSSGSYGLIISEICAKNDSILADNEGKHRDYIELYNPGETLDLTGFTLTDGKGTSQPFSGVILEKGAYRVFFLGSTVTGFALGASGGDCVQLLDPQGNIAVQATVASLQADQVMLYDPTGYKLSYDATPGFSNDADGLAAFKTGTEAADPALVISEVLTANVSAYPGPLGRFPDMVELHNRSNQPIYLGSFFLTDDPSQRFACRLPDRILAPGEYLLICCDGENRVDEAGLIHGNFALSQGETLVLTDSMGASTAAVLTVCEDDASLSRREDGSFAPGPVSLGYPNGPEGALLYSQARIRADSPLVISEILLSAAGVPFEGAFRDVVEIWNRSDSPVSTEGWYLSDSPEPFAWPLPEKTLAPGERLVIPCGSGTTGFSLAVGETVRLMGPDWRFATPVTCVSGDPGLSLQLQGDNAYGFGAVTLGTETHKEFLSAQLGDGLRFWELMSANQSYLKGPYASTCDWVEFYNSADEEIQLSDYCLTDSKGNLSKYPLPEMILAPGEYCVILLSEDMTNLRKGYSAIPTNLSSDGETLYLSKAGQIEDYVFLPELSADISYGRGSGAEYTVLLEPTPGEENSDAAHMAPVPTVNHPQGVYDGVEYLEITLSGEGTVYYTTDCSTPGRYSRKYTEPIRLTKTTVIRAVCIPETGIPSEVLDLTYVINEYDQLAVVSVVTPPKNLWSDESGIYVTGDNAAEEMPHYGANYWMDWEKLASLSLFEPEGGGFSVKCGIQIFGGFTRTLDKKSLACFFRDVYGDGSLSYPLFGENSLDQYESIVLRTSGQDAFTARMRDVVITSLMGEHTDVPVQQYKPVVVYLNGEYWGLHYIREKINENYIAAHYNMAPEDVHLTELGGWYDKSYIALRNFVMKNDMSIQENYDYVCSQMDVDNYIDFFAAEMWIANRDNGNVKYFISPEGKWTWIFYDTDISFNDASEDRVEHNLKSSGIGSNDITCRTFAVRMLENPEFKEKFLTRLAWQMNNLWTEENIITRIDEIEAMIIGDMEKECRRWGTSYQAWLGSVEHLRTFARERNAYMLQHIREYFGLSSQQMRSYGFQV